MRIEQLKETNRNAAAMRPRWTQLQMACYLCNFEPPTSDLRPGEYQDLFFTEEGDLTEIHAMFNEIGDAIKNDELPVFPAREDPDWMKKVFKTPVGFKGYQRMKKADPPCSISPSNAIAWAIERGYEIHPTFLRLVDTSNTQQANSDEDATVPEKKSVSEDRMLENDFVKGSYEIDKNNVFHLKVFDSGKIRGHATFRPTDDGKLSKQAKLLNFLCGSPRGRAKNGEVALVVYEISRDLPLERGLPKKQQQLYRDTKKALTNRGVNSQLLSIPKMYSDPEKWPGQIVHLHIQTKKRDIGHSTEQVTKQSKLNDMLDQEKSTDGYDALDQEL